MQRLPIFFIKFVISVDFFYSYHFVKENFANDKKRKIIIGAAHGKRYTMSKFSVFVFSLILMVDLRKKPA